MSSADLSLGISRESLKTLPLIQKEIATNSQTLATAVQGRSTDCKCSAVVLSILALVALGGSGALIAFSGGPSNTLLFISGSTLGAVGLGKVIWMVVIVIQSKKYREAQTSEEFEFSQQLVSYEDIFNSFKDHRATEEIITGVVRALQPIEFKALVDHINTLESRPEKVIAALVAHDDVGSQTQLSRPFIIDLLRKMDGSKASVLLDHLGPPGSAEEYTVYGRFPNLMVNRVVNYTPEQIVGIYRQMDEDRKDPFREALKVHLGTLTDEQFASFVARFNDKVSVDFQPILDLIAFYPARLDLIEKNLSEPLRLNLATHFDAEKGIGVALLRSVILHGTIKEVSKTLEGERSLQFLASLVGVLLLHGLKAEHKKSALECCKNIFGKFNSSLDPENLKSHDGKMISLFGRFPTDLATWHYQENIGLHPTFVELFYEAMSVDSRKEYRAVISRIEGEDRIEAFVRFVGAALVIMEPGRTSHLGEICVSHPFALAKISCEIFETKALLSKLQQLRRIDGGESSQLYFDYLSRVNQDHARALVIMDLQNIFDEKQAQSDLNLGGIPLIQWLLTRPKFLALVAAQMTDAELPSLRMLTDPKNGLDIALLVGYFKELYNTQKRTASREVSFLLQAIVKEKAAEPALNISGKPIIQWLITTPSVFKDVFTTDFFTKDQSLRISLGLKVLELMPPKHAKEVMLDQLDKGTGENDFSRFVTVLWSEKGAAKLEELPAERGALISLFGLTYKEITLKPKKIPDAFIQFSQTVNKK